MLMKVGSRYPIPLGEPSRPASRKHLRPVEDLDATLPIGQAARPRVPEVLPMRCLRCQGPVEKGMAPVCLERDGYSLSWEQVPAWVCGRCELAYFEPEAVETVRHALVAMRTLKPKTGEQ